MIDTILFDLDGTLLSMDTDEFIKNYFAALSVKLKDYFTPEEVVKYFWSSTEYMINNVNPNKTNEEAFFEDFYQYIDDVGELNDVLDEFYKKDFNSIKEVSEVNKNIVESIKVLKAKGYDLVVATNPLFPLTAILNRIEWAGLDKEDFIFITSFEEMHFCKPQIQYYSEILDKINKNSTKCLMVGNDVEEDMIAKEIGIDTYLIIDNIIGDLSDDKNIDHHGTYKDFYNFVLNLPII